MDYEKWYETEMQRLQLQADAVLDRASEYRQYAEHIYYRGIVTEREQAEFVRMIAVEKTFLHLLKLIHEKMDRTAQDFDNYWRDAETAYDEGLL